MPPDVVIEVLGNVYGQNDAPAAWFKEFDTVIQSLGWQPSKLDPCLIQLCAKVHNWLVSRGVHVDGTTLGEAWQSF